ncbi:uncharacterized protein LOC110095703 [Dendrobium catenatum]|uniref:Uncharacterized protein n=1 Tax=Dendrobium catenatum TaxID=906689 RepID=A0A2I0WWN7_9ASPA|nr:uncharacterized protein LOC110095703 [Dendrobium catenatum]PKU80078.1 hypothetical protein MA16_Dca025084 [Dendrobium catenatum]
MRKEKAMEEPKVLLGGAEKAEWPQRRRKKGAAAVKLEGYVDEGESPVAGEDGGTTVGRTKSLTDEDLEELKGCLDLGFGFSYEEIPELCGTLPALELCYSMSQRFLDEQQQQRSAAGYNAVSAISPVRVANWKISNPGDHPDEVKARLKYWAQAVACTVKLCS